MPLGIKPTVDFAFKKIFGSPENVPVLIGLLNAILDYRFACSAKFCLPTRRHRITISG